jgi:site-specific recombinase XerD
MTTELTGEGSAGQLAVLQPTAIISDPGDAYRDLDMPLEARRASENPYYVYLDSLASAESERAMKRHLDQIACIVQGLEYPTEEKDIGAHFPWEQVRFRHAAKIRAAIIRKGWAPSTVNGSLTALRKVLEAAWDLELISTNDYHHARKIKNVKAERVVAGRSVGHDEVIRMRDACIRDIVLAEQPKERHQGIRDIALVLLLWSTGLREAEATAAKAEDYDAAERSLKVIGKGNKQRIVFVHENTAEALERWLEVTSAATGPIFRRVSKHGHLGEGALSESGVRHIVNTRRVQAGLRPFTVHDFRRTFIGDVLDAGAHLPQVQALAGHENADTTSKYVRHDLRALRDAVDRLSVPPMPTMPYGVW